MKTKASQSPSLGDIAKKTGFSRMTVSYALRNSPRLSRDTCLKVQAAARELGYVPDARISSWLAQVRDSKSRGLVPIAWLNTDNEIDAWRKYKWLAPYREGAEQRCHEMGYKLDEIWLREPGMDANRISNILYHRGIRGVVVAPSRISVAHLQLNWNHFACAGFEKAVLAPRLHRVAPDYYYNMLLALKLLRRFGYRRIGIFMQQLAERRSQHAYVAGLNYFYSKIPSSERLKPLIYEDDKELRNRPIFAKWLERTKPDVILGHHGELIRWVEKAGFRVPKDIGIVHLALEDDCADWAGIWQRKREIGAETVELVISMLQNNRYGLPKVAHDTMIPGYWHPGKTLITPKVKL